MKPITYAELQPGDFFKPSWDMDVLICLKVEKLPSISEGAPSAVDVHYQRVKDGRKNSRSFNQNFLVNILRPGERDIELTQINLTR